MRVTARFFMGEDMLRFDSDYMETACPQILDRLNKIVFEKNTGYGEDVYSQSAREKIKNACKAPQAEVYFLTGGTQANICVISSSLGTVEAVIAAQTAHINTHEAGAIEASGHKVLTVPSDDGKVSAQAVEDYMAAFNADRNNAHIPQPAMVYISQPTESGTVYTKSELIALRMSCDRHGLSLYIDGARLGYALASEGNDLWLPDIAALCDAFYIGGTKVGAMLGEAVVLCNTQLFRHFFTHIKSRGALLAKGWMAGIQFDTLFTDDLYLRISRNAIERAKELKAALAQKGYRFYIDSPTNQQFIIVDDEKLDDFEGKFTYGFWLKLNETQTVIRLTTSWATTADQIEELKKFL